MQQHTTWSFSSTRESIDVARILSEAPADCRLLEVAIEGGPERLVAIRRAAYDRAVASGHRPEAGSAYGWDSRSPSVDPDGGFRPGFNGSGWLVAYGRGVTTIESLAATLAASDAHYVQRVRVEVRAV